MAHPHKDQSGLGLPSRSLCMHSAACCKSCETSNPDTASKPTKPSVLLGPGRREGTRSRRQARMGRLEALSWPGKSVLC